MLRSVEELEALVPVMRKLGVRVYDGIELAPERVEPAPIKLTPDQILERMDREAERRHDIMFAATRVKPHLPRPERRGPVVQRVTNAHQRGGGAQEKA